MAVSREVLRELIAKAQKPKQLPVEPDEHERDEPPRRHIRIHLRSNRRREEARE